MPLHSNLIQQTCQRNPYLEYMDLLQDDDCSYFNILYFNKNVAKQISEPAETTKNECS